MTPSDSYYREFWKRHPGDAFDVISKLDSENRRLRDTLTESLGCVYYIESVAVKGEPSSLRSLSSNLSSLIEKIKEALK